MSSFFFIALAIAGLFIIRRRDVNYVGYRTFLYPLTPIVFLVLVTIVLLLIGVGNPLQTLLGAVVVVLGLPVYFLYFRKKLEKNLNGLDQNNSLS